MCKLWLRPLNDFPWLCLFFHRFSRPRPRPNFMTFHDAYNTIRTMLLSQIPVFSNRTSLSEIFQCSTWATETNFSLYNSPLSPPSPSQCQSLDLPLLNNDPHRPLPLTSLSVIFRSALASEINFSLSSSTFCVSVLMYWSSTSRGI